VHPPPRLFALGDAAFTVEFGPPQARDVPPDIQARVLGFAAGLAELQPWVEQWHSELDPTFGVSPAQFAREQLSEHLKSLGLTVDDLAAWRPPAPTRGRRAAK